METQQNKCHLRVIQGGLTEEGPITRMGLKDRLRFSTPEKILMAVGTKLVLLACVLYVIYG